MFLINKKSGQSILKLVAGVRYSVLAEYVYFILKHNIEKYFSAERQYLTLQPYMKFDWWIIFIISAGKMMLRYEIKSLYAFPR